MLVSGKVSHSDLTEIPSCVRFQMISESTKGPFELKMTQTTGFFFHSSVQAGSLSYDLRPILAYPTWQLGISLGMFDFRTPLATLPPEDRD